MADGVRMSRDELEGLSPAARAQVLEQLGEEIDDEPTEPKPSRSSSSSGSGRRRRSRVRSAGRKVARDATAPTRGVVRSSVGGVVKLMLGVVGLIGLYWFVTIIDRTPERAYQLFGAPARFVTWLLDPTRPPIPYRTEASPS